MRAIIGLGASSRHQHDGRGRRGRALQARNAALGHCGELRGYLFSPPVPGDGARAIIDAYFGKVAAVA